MTTVATSSSLEDRVHRRESKPRLYCASLLAKSPQHLLQSVVHRVAQPESLTTRRLSQPLCPTTRLKPLQLLRSCICLPVSGFTSFNSLFKVLFNFPSRYLFTIGLTVVFSLSRSLPAPWGYTLK
jgi:hypothetical protein